MTKRPFSLEQAKARYTTRFTMDHVPAWAKIRARNGMFYAPQFASDEEWYEHTLFNGEPGYLGQGHDCYTTDPVWPLGKWLPSVYDPVMWKKPMPWCNHCKCYHHETAACISKSAGPDLVCWEHQANREPIRLSFSIKVF